MPAPKSESGDNQSQKGDGQESLSSQQTSKEASPVNTPVHLRQSEQNVPAQQSPQRPLNLLPEVPETANSAGRKFSEREKRDCEVIGIKNLLFFIRFQKCIPILASLELARPNKLKPNILCRLANMSAPLMLRHDIPHLSRAYLRLH